MDARLEELIKEKPRNLLTLCGITGQTPVRMMEILLTAEKKGKIHQFNKKFYPGPDKEPPDPDDYESIKSFKAAWKRWEQKFPGVKYEYFRS